MKTYLYNTEKVQDRTGNYDRAEAIAERWEPIGGDIDHCGMSLYYYKPENRFITYDQAKEKTAETFIITDDNIYLFSDCISPALWFYRSVNLFYTQPQVNNWYKGFWQLPIKHRETGICFIFTEWKGSPSLHWDAVNEEPEPEKVEVFMDDLNEMLLFMLSDEMPHPYDRTVSGTQA